jgi:hypothetical protein
MSDNPRPTQKQVEAALTSLVRDARLLVSEVSLDEPRELDNINAQAATIRAALAERDQLAAEVESYRTQFAELAVDLDTTIKEKQRMWAEITRLRAALVDPAAGEE